MYSVIIEYYFAYKHKLIRIYHLLCIGEKSFRLTACSADGQPESQIVEFAWSTIIRWESDDEAMAFCLEYDRGQDKGTRWLKVFTPYHIYLADCFDRVAEERKD